MTIKSWTLLFKSDGTQLHSQKSSCSCLVNTFTVPVGQKSNAILAFEKRTLNIITGHMHQAKQGPSGRKAQLAQGPTPTIPSVTNHKCVGLVKYPKL